MSQDDRAQTGQADQAALWRELTALDSDFVFEADADGVIRALEPATVLGWQSSALIGHKAEDRWLDPASGFDPFRTAAPVRRRKVNLRTADNTLASVQITALPFSTVDGRIMVRGIGHDMTRQENRDSAHAAERRRVESFLTSLDDMRHEMVPVRRIQVVIDHLLTGLNAEGLVVAELFGKHQPPVPRHRAGSGADRLQAALSLLDSETTDPQQGFSPDSAPVVICPLITRFGERVVIAAWRPVNAAAWAEGDIQLMRMTAAVLGAVLEHESIQREMARQVKNDPLTGLLNRRAFISEAIRRIDRLDREELNCTLMLIDLDDYSPLGRLGPEAGDEALCIMARILRAAVRPADLVARLGGGSFVAWMDGADELTGAERAEMLRLQAPSELAQLAAAPGLPLTISMGIACRRPGYGEELDSLMRRASLALEEARHGGWRVSRDEPL